MASYKNRSRSMTRPTPTKKQLYEAEKISSQRYYRDLALKIEQDVQNFPVRYYNSARHVECYAYDLAVDYLNGKSQGLIGNDQLDEMAKTLTSTFSNYETIRRMKDPRELQNKNSVKILLQVINECVESAYQFATYRSKTRHDAQLEFLVDGQNHTHSVLAQMDTKQDNHGEKLDLTLAELKKVQAMIEDLKAAKDALPVAPTQVKSKTRTTAPKWIISNAETDNIFKKCTTPDSFAKELSIRLFSPLELLLKMDSSNEKLDELLNVCHHYFPTISTFPELIKATITHLRTIKRGNLYQKMRRHEYVTYGVTNSGFGFYLTQDRKCSDSFGKPMNTKRVGTFEVPIKCASSDYIYFFTKLAGKKITIKKMLKNGNVETCE